jgi:hypothetical protein
VAASRTWQGLGTSLSGAATTLGKFSNIMGVVRGGLAALGIAEVIGKITGGIDDFNKKMLDLNRTSQALGLDPEVIKKFRKEVEKTGGDADEAVRGLTAFARQVNDAVVEARNNGQALENNVRVYRGLGDAAKTATTNVVTMRGSLTDSTNAATAAIQVFHGASKSVTDLNDPLKALGVTAGKYTEEQLKQGAAIRDVIAGLERFKGQGKNAEANALAFRLFGKTTDEVVASLKGLLAVMGQQSGALKEPIDNAKQYQAALVDLQTELNKIPNEIAAGLTPLATQWLVNLTEFQKAQNQEIRNLWAATKAFWQGDLVPFFATTQATLAQGVNDFAARWQELKAGIFGTDWATLWQSLSQTAIDALSGIGKWWGELLQSMLTGITNLATQIGSILSSIASSVGQALRAVPTPFATGGRVPGSGTGDTVPAWLTPGEYVNRRASVDYYGPRIFAALNARMIPREMFSSLGFAMGGLVGGPPMAFAGGGEVPGGGTPVHLHLGGHSFALSGSENVVSALVVEARRHQMRAAGTKPSWYGGTPGR